MKYLELAISEIKDILNAINMEKEDRLVFYDDKIRNLEIELSRTNLEVKELKEK